MSRTGSIVSWTRIVRAPPGHDVPFVLALIDTDEGRVLARMEDAPVDVGMRVVVGEGGGGGFRAQP